MTQSIERAIEVLFYVAESGSGRSLTEISAATGLSKATAFRVTQTLVSAELFRHDKVRRRFFPGNALYRMASLLEHGQQLREIALPHMQDLRERTKETVSLVVPRGMERVTIEVLPGFYELRLVPEIHSRKPIYVGAPGKALLAFVPKRELERLMEETGLAPITSRTITSKAALMRDLARIRERGYATSVEETVEGGAAAAAPIFDASEEVIGAVNVFGPMFRLKGEVLKRYGGLAASVARKISRDLGAPERLRSGKVA